MTLELLAKKYTIEEFLELDLPEEDGPYELIRGEIVSKKQQPAPSKEHGRIIGELTYHIKDYLKDKPQNQLFSGSASTIPGLNYLIPDISVLETARVSTDPDVALPYPDLAIEVVSRSDTWFKVRDKAIDYLKAGTRLVWVVFWPDKLVFVYRPNEVKPEVLFFDNFLTGEPFLPGFKLEVNKLF